MSHEDFTVAEIIIVAIDNSIVKLVCRTKYDTMPLASTGGRSLVAAPQSQLLAN